jgi:hypothetical protein
MQHHHHSDISDSYHCKRSHSGDIVHVYNSNHYLMAEYTVRTGRTSWQRVAPLTQRESVEKWLRNNYPVNGAPPAATVETKSKSRGKVA